MFIVDLICGAGHLFEDWYDNKEAFDGARDAATLSCPVCGDVDVEQRPSFRGIISRSSSPAARSADETTTTTTTTEPTTTTTTTTTAALGLPLEVQRKLSALLKLVRAHTQDAGESFATRALAMHKGDEEPVPIHGTSTPEEQQTLREEGVPFGLIPVPEIDQN